MTPLTAHSIKTLGTRTATHCSEGFPSNAAFWLGDMKSSSNLSFKGKPGRAGNNGAFMQFRQMNKVPLQTRYIPITDRESGESRWQIGDSCLQYVL